MKEDLANRLESEVTRMNKVKKIQEEVDNLKNSITACIDIVSSSVGNSHTQERLRRLKEENEVSYSRVTNEIEETLENTRQNINQIKIEQKALEEKEEEYKEEEKEEPKKGSDE